MPWSNVRWRSVKDFPITGSINNPTHKGQRVIVFIILASLSCVGGEGDSGTDQSIFLCIVLGISGD